jgi:acetyl esterase/lipase
MFRHGYIRSPVHWHKVKQPNFTGIWIIDDEKKDPDIVVYYTHGGGFSMGSSYFYLEFLLAWLDLLKTIGNFKNPAIFALEYTLVPDEAYPVQLREIVSGYKYVLSITEDTSRICVGGDSAGGTLVLSLLLHLATISGIGNAKSLAKDLPRKSSPLTPTKDDGKASMMPEMAVLISPWVTLQSPHDKDTPSDYLNAANLHQYGLQYAGTKISVNDPLVSPGNCKAISWWRKACPTKGFFVMYGAEEVFAYETRGLIKLWEEANIPVSSIEEEGGIHAWPVACLFLSSTREERQKGLKVIVGEIRERMRSTAES